ncbi:MAG: bifunctional hydroxymethylpyrimidine kinase/phosphomethylpyrimidine kinase [Deltaproteobacteria bacterium]|nr:bifunctional hydroxymethylpyrimidine kinase/phosphomethylpyrimidine kinase [Deltaproteobacteria bacterium]
MISQNTLIHPALKAIRGRKAVLVGDLVLDNYVYGEALRVSREAPVVVVRKERVEYRLGGAANTAANLAAFGLNTQVVGVVANDENGVRLKKMLASAGADVTAIQAGDYIMPVKTRILAGAFGTSRQQVLRIDDEPREELPATLLESIAAKALARGSKADVVVISDYGYGIASNSLIETARALVQKGIPVCVDSRYQLPAFAGVTAVTPNIPEAEQLVGFAINDSHAVDRAGRQIIEKLQIKACLLTQGRGGMTLFSAHKQPQHVEIVGDEEVTDVTGAGDTVIAGFAGGLAAGLGTRNSMILANIAAGVVVTKVGAATASEAEIIASAEHAKVELTPWDV